MWVFLIGVQPQLNLTSLTFAQNLVSRFWTSGFREELRCQLSAEVTAVQPAFNLGTGKIAPETRQRLQESGEE